MANAQITYNRRLIQNGQDLVLTNLSNGVGVTYGDWTQNPITGIMTKRSTVKFNITYTNIVQVINPNNSITVSFTVTVSQFKRTVNSTGNPANATVQSKIDGTQYWNFTESVEVASTHAGHSKSFSVTVQPESTNWGASVWFKNTMAITSDEADIGMKIYNPNPPDYRPGQQRNSSDWKSHNRSGGKADIRRSGSWVTMRTYGGSAAQRPGDQSPFIRVSGSWKNQKKIGSGG